MFVNGLIIVIVKIEEGEDSGVYGMNLLCDLFMLFNFLEYWFWVFDEIWLCINSCER